MEYLSPSKCPRFEVTDSLKVSNIDVGGALNSLLSGLNTLSANDVNFKNIDCTTLDATGNVTAATNSSGTCDDQGVCRRLGVSHSRYRFDSIK